MSVFTTLESFAETIGTDVESIVDTEYHAFLTNILPLYDDLKAFAETTGKADLATLLADLKADLVTGVETAITSGGNVGAVIAAEATQTLSQVKGVVAADGKNALYGALAIVAADIPAISGVPSTVAASPAPSAPPTA